MSINIVSARFSDVSSQILPLISEHWTEVGYNYGSVDLDPDWDAYKRMDEQGNLSIILAFNSDDTLIGYCVDIVHNHIHHRGNRYAVNDIFYVHPAYRKSHVPVEILKIVQLYLKEEMGAQSHMITMMDSHRWDRTAQAAGYSQIETVHAIDLTKVGE